MVNLEIAILASLSYFDAHNYPLTSFEIYKWLYCKNIEISYNYGQVLSALKNSEKLSEALESKNGYYFLKGRQELVKTRQSNYVITASKAKIIKRIAKIFSYIPFLQMAAACNDFGFNSLNKNSDLDLFIIVKHGRIHLVRLISISIITLLGLRPTKQNKKDKVCLSFFITDKNLNLSEIKFSEEDIYLSYWLSTLYPFFGFKKYHELMDENNLILKNLKNNIFSHPSFRRRIEYPIGVRVFLEKLLSGKFGDYLEKISFNLQKRKLNIKKNIVREEKTAVVINENMLKFHENDNRKYFYEEYKKKMASYECN